MSGRPDRVSALTAAHTQQRRPGTRLVAALLLAAVLGVAGASANQTTAPGKWPGSEYGPSVDSPYGRPNPEAPPETSQYAFMIGVFDCELEYKTFRDGEWVLNQQGRATWRASWVLDGYAILDEFTDEGGSRALNLRIFDSEANLWKIHWAAMEVPGGDIFNARHVDGRMVMDAERTTDSGFEYVQRLAFEPTGPDHYRWSSEIIYPDGASVVMDKIECARFA